jgi:hypothetical protein
MINLTLPIVTENNKNRFFTALSESDVAELTDVRLVAGVSPQVHVQRVFLIEVARTHCAL